jgi:hypothetical protein
MKFDSVHVQQIYLQDQKGMLYAYIEVGFW